MPWSIHRTKEKGFTSWKRFIPNLIAFVVEGYIEPRPPAGLEIISCAILNIVANMGLQMTFVAQAPLRGQGMQVWKKRFDCVCETYTGLRKPMLATAARVDPPSISRDVGSASRPFGSNAGRSDGIAHVVLICGFETFNRRVYTAAAEAVSSAGINVTVLTDADLMPLVRNPLKTAEIDVILESASAVLCSLLFDYDLVQWLAPRLPTDVPIFVFESALELMAYNRVGSFSLPSKDSSSSEASSASMPAPVKTILQKLGLVAKEEDKLAGYLALLNSASTVLKLVPGDRARDLRHWLVVYSYWNASGSANVSSMLNYIVRNVLEKLPPAEEPPIVQTPSIGLLHPTRTSFFEHPAEYVQWYSRKFPERRDWPRVAVLLYRKHVISGLKYIPRLIGLLEDRGIVPLPVFISGVEAHIVLRDYLTSYHKENSRSIGERVFGSFRRGKLASVDAVVSTIGFPLVGGPAGSMAGGRQADVGQKILQQLNVPYTVSAPLLLQDFPSWESSGVNGLQSVVLYSLPELDGAIDPVPLGALVGEDICLQEDRVARLANRLRKWTALRRTPNAQKRIAIVLYGFPPAVGATGTAALLDVPSSLVALVARLKLEGYDVGDGDRLSGDEILERVKLADEVMQGGRLSGSEANEMLASTVTVSADALRDWMNSQQSERIEKSWGDFGSSSNLKTLNGQFLLGGLKLGNVWIGVQPPLGIVGDPMRLLFDRDMTPHPQYAAFYRWLTHGFDANAVIHFGMHGTYEWLPGKQLGNTANCWPDILLGDLPNIYIYAANNPSEASLAKRRGYATVVSHAVPPYGRAGLYGELQELKGLIADFMKARGRESDDKAMHAIKEEIENRVRSSGLVSDLSIEESASVDDYVSELSGYLKKLESRLFSSGLHVFGRALGIDNAVAFADALLDDLTDEISEDVRGRLARAVVAKELGLSQYEYAEWWEMETTKYDGLERVKVARDVIRKLGEGNRELDSVIRGLSGEFVRAVAGGDVLRDGIGVLPTGCNIHALDPYRLPSTTAFITGRQIAESVIKQHREANGGAFPETVAVPLWGLDNIKTGGESVGIVLGFLGAEVVRDATGRVSKFELVGLEKLGRPRVDVLMNLSGIFRDSFEHVVNLLDDVFRRAACANESVSENFVRKHAEEIEGGDKGDELDGGARVFSNAAGDYGSMVNETVSEGSWENGDELGDIYVGRNAFVYGREKRGVRDEETLRRLLGTTQRVVQQVDSVEYGLSDIQEYYANTGALLRAARKESGNEGVRASIVEAFGSVGGGNKGREARDLEDVLRVELRTRLLNPKWAERMLDCGKGGAFEVSSRMTALVGWGGTAEFAEDFVFEQAARTYVENENNRKRLELSAEAYRNVVARLLEAAGRGIWKEPAADLLERLRSELERVDSEVEGVD